MGVDSRQFSGLVLEPSAQFLVSITTPGTKNVILKAKK